MLDGSLTQFAGKYKVHEPFGINDDNSKFVFWCYKQHSACIDGTLIPRPSSYTVFGLDLKSKASSGRLQIRAPQCSGFKIGTVPPTQPLQLRHIFRMSGMSISAAGLEGTRGARFQLFIYILGLHSGLFAWVTVQRVLLYLRMPVVQPRQSSLWLKQPMLPQASFKTFCLIDRTSRSLRLFCCRQTTSQFIENSGVHSIPVVLYK